MMREAWIVFDLGFGDAGKGATVDFLVRDRGADLVIRYNGGAQAGHNVVTLEGRHHTFSQFGSGTFVPETRTLLGPEFVLHPGALAVEAEHLREIGVSDAFERLNIDEQALVISPFQQAAGRIREIARGPDYHGTCGVGVGEAVCDSLTFASDTIRVADFQDVGVLARKLRLQQQRKRHEFRESDSANVPATEEEIQLLEDRSAVDRTLSYWQPLLPQLRITSSIETRRLIESSTTMIFEGAQGVLLDQDHGFHPHTTWSDCTPGGAFRLLAGIRARVTRLAVMRSYMVRHGAGPFPTFAPRYDRLPEPHNNATGWQGCFRRGPLDLVLLKYALESAGGAEGLAVTHLDSIGRQTTVCHAYTLDGRPFSLPREISPGDFSARVELCRDLYRALQKLDSMSIEALMTDIERKLGVPVLLSSHGPTSKHRRWLRTPS